MVRAYGKASPFLTPEDGLQSLHDNRPTILRQFDDVLFQPLTEYPRLDIQSPRMDMPIDSKVSCSAFDQSKDEIGGRDFWRGRRQHASMAQPGFLLPDEMQQLFDTCAASGGGRSAALRALVHRALLKKATRPRRCLKPRIPEDGHAGGVTVRLSGTDRDWMRNAAPWE